MSEGYLIVNVYADTIAQPIRGAMVEVLEQNQITFTDGDGKSELLALKTPDEQYSEIPQHEIKPYATYDIRVTKEGMKPVIIDNVEIYPGILSNQEVFMHNADESDGFDEVVIDDNALWGDYPPKVEESPEPAGAKVLPPKTKVLPRVIIPEYIVVHDGAPSATNVPNYYVSFPDYIKNVASSEIYATWPTETIKANVAAIVSFTLNRIYTEWYRSKGYNFTITSLPSYDQKYTHGRTIFKTISDVVDDYFRDYINFPGRLEPFLAQYNDGINSNNAGWLSQWGSKELGDKGYSALEILKNYYGNSLTLKEANVVADYPTSFPGYNMKLGDCSEAIQKLQNELNKIRGNYPGIPVIPNPNGIFDQATVNAVKKFQEVFGLTPDGIVGYSTWYKISYVFTAVSKLMP